MSSFDVTVLDEQEFLRVTTMGQYSLAGLFEMLTSASAEAKRLEKTRVLIDSRLLEGNMTEAERFEGGQKIAKLFGPRIKLAVVMPAEKITGLGQLAAANRGARFFVTPSEQDALDWLLGPG